VNDYYTILIASNPVKQKVPKPADTNIM